ncbi:hypothetical protein E4U32_002235 [Claviceps aff. humidiphila group G2b]|nr:hypothetical protein E4U32_002235 [Claviceps aff. humidiphila group G2b]
MEKKYFDETLRELSLNSRLLMQIPVSSAGASRDCDLSDHQWRPTPQDGASAKGGQLLND